MCRFEEGLQRELTSQYEGWLHTQNVSETLRDLHPQRNPRARSAGFRRGDLLTSSTSGFEVPWTTFTPSGQRELCSERRVLGENLTLGSEAAPLAQSRTGGSRKGLHEMGAGRQEWAGTVSPGRLDQRRS